MRKSLETKGLVHIMGTWYWLVDLEFISSTLTLPSLRNVSPVLSANTSLTQLTLPMGRMTSTVSTATRFVTGRKPRPSQCRWTRPPSLVTAPWGPAPGVGAKCSPPRRWWLPVVTITATASGVSSAPNLWTAPVSVTDLTTRSTAGNTPLSLSLSLL